MQWMTSAPARQFVSKYKSAGKRWQDVLPSASAQAIDFISKMLQFDPAKRITAEQALEHPFVADFHDIKTEPRCSRMFQTAFDGITFKSRQMLQDFAMEEVYKFRPHLRPRGPSATDKYLEPPLVLATRVRTAKRKASSITAAASDVKAVALDRKPKPATATATSSPESTDTESVKSSDSTPQLILSPDSESVSLVQTPKAIAMDISPSPASTSASIRVETR